jgi:hypothetical protein
MNDPEVRVLPVGSVCGHGTAESMAKFHAILGEGGVWEGKRLLSKESVDRFQQMKSAGFDLTFSMDGMWSYGMMLFPVMEQGKPVSGQKKGKWIEKNGKWAAKSGKWAGKKTSKTNKWARETRNWAGGKNCMEKR